MFSMGEVLVVINVLVERLNSSFTSSKSSLHHDRVSLFIFTFI